MVADGDPDQVLVLGVPVAGEESLAGLATGDGKGAVVFKECLPDRSRISAEPMPQLEQMTVVHEIGHEFALKDLGGPLDGIMGALLDFDPLTSTWMTTKFVGGDLKMIRSSPKSPGKR